MADGRKGSVMIIAIIIIAMLAGLSIAVLDPVSTSSRKSEIHYNYKRATLTAFSAGERVKYNMGQQGLTDPYGDGTSPDGTSQCVLDAIDNSEWTPVKVEDNGGIDRAGVTFPVIDMKKDNGDPLFDLTVTDTAYPQDFTDNASGNSIRYIVYSRETGSGDAISYVSADCNGVIRNVRVDYSKDTFQDTIPHESYFHAIYAANQWNVLNYLYQIQREDNIDDDIFGDIYINGSIAFTGEGWNIPEVEGTIKATGDIEGEPSGNRVFELMPGYDEIPPPDLSKTSDWYKQLGVGPTGHERDPVVDNRDVVFDDDDDWDNGESVVEPQVFNGTDDWVDLGNSPSYNLENNVGVECWIRTTDNAHGYFVSKGDQWNEDGHWAIGQNYDNDGDGKLELQLELNGSFNAQLDAPCEVNDGEWHHVVGTYDNNTLKLYVDGELKAQDTVGSGALQGTTDDGLFVMRRGTDRVIGGQIDGVRVYDRALTDTEVSQAASADRGSSNVATDAQVATWTSPTETIQEGSENDGTNYIAGIICPHTETGESQDYMDDNATSDVTYVIDSNFGQQAGSSDPTYDSGTDSVIVTVPDEYNNKAIFIPGDFWFDILDPVYIDFKTESGDPANLTFIVEGNVYMTDGVNRKVHPDAPAGGTISVIALRNGDGDGGNISYGDPSGYGRIDPIKSFLYAENSFIWLPNAQSAGDFDIYGNMTSSGTIDFTNRPLGDDFIDIMLQFDEAILDQDVRDSLPCLPQANVDEVIIQTSPYSQRGFQFLD